MCRLRLYIAGIVGMSAHPETYDAMVWQMISYIPAGYKRVDLIADSCNDSSIKSKTTLRRAGSAVEHTILIKYKYRFYHISKEQS